ncbi:hypothetical protein LMG1860_01344 [Achromobacter denitrificans]|nr:hypothetical protein LMG1860_01344 [Achromobacter denitrificans]
MPVFQEAREKVSGGSQHPRQGRDHAQLRIDLGAVLRVVQHQAAEAIHRRGCCVRDPLEDADEADEQGSGRRVNQQGDRDCVGGLPEQQPLIEAGAAVDPPADIAIHGNRHGDGDRGIDAQPPRREAFPFDDEVAHEGCQQRIGESPQEEHGQHGARRPLRQWLGRGRLILFIDRRIKIGVHRRRRFSNDPGGQGRSRLHDIGRRRRWAPASLRTTR